MTTRESMGAPHAADQLPRLLILRCSSRKLPGSEPMPAIQRYDGPAFRVLRKYLRTEPDDPPLVRIVSAEHGLISLSQPIEDYDRRMDVERAQELRSSVLGAVQALVAERPVRDVLVVVGQPYLLALEGIEDVLSGTPVRIAGETQGRKLGALRAWLYGKDAEQSAKRRARSTPAAQQLQLVPSGELVFQLGGKRFATTADEVLRVAHRAVEDGDREATRVLRWYVPAAGGRVSPKWLVSSVSGVLPSAFQADSARRILQRLGVPVIEIDAGDTARS